MPIRSARPGQKVLRIVPAGADRGSHLDAQMVLDVLAEWRLEDFEFLFIENVENRVCPSSYDLGGR